MQLRKTECTLHQGYILIPENEKEKRGIFPRFPPFEYFTGSKIPVPGESHIRPKVPTECNHFSLEHAIIDGGASPHGAMVGEFSTFQSTGPGGVDSATNWP